MLAVWNVYPVQYEAYCLGRSLFHRGEAYCTGAPCALITPIIIRDDRKALHFVFPGTIYYLTIVKKRFIPPAPLNRGPSGCSTGVKCSPYGMRSLFNWDPAPLLGFWDEGPH
jgi:hypothetical protein